MQLVSFCFYTLTMKIKKLLAAIFSVLSASAFSQQIALDSFNTKKLQINKRGMTVLASWGAANIAWGAIAKANASGSDKYFHEMNMIWGGINLGLSALGYIGSRKRQMLNTAATLQKQTAVEKTFLFNAGLDVAYIAGGFYLTEKAKNDLAKHDRYKGYGNSIVLQGAALLLFDGVMYLIHNKHGKQLYQNADNWHFTLTGNGAGLVIGL